MTRLLLTVACLCLAACAPAPDEAPAADRLAEGRWTGGLTPMNHPDMVTPIAYDVAYEGDRLALTLLGDGGTPMPAREVALHADTLRFVFDEPDAGRPLSCALARAPEGGFGGRCTDADGKWARFTMTPPG